MRRPAIICAKVSEAVDRGPGSIDGACGRCFAAIAVSERTQAMLKETSESPTGRYRLICNDCYVLEAQPGDKLLDQDTGAVKLTVTGHDRN